MVQKKFLALSMVLCLLLSGSLPVFSQQSSPDSFKVIGYCSEIFSDPVENIQYDKLTHVIYAFLIPGDDGSLIGIEKPEKLKALVTAAHAEGVKVSIAVGGWSYRNVPLQGNFVKMAGNVISRKEFVRNTVQFLKDYDLDGLDLDWEFPTASGPYEALVRDLRLALNAENMLLSAALNGAWSATGAPLVSSFVTDECLTNFDFINIMAYDADPTGPGHSPVWFADTSIQYWASRGVPREKIILGVPFYGAPGWVQYRDLVKDNAVNANLDRAEIVVGNWGKTPVYYNGIATIQEKTRLALLQAGGVMIFDINEDTMDRTSLISAIDEVVKNGEDDSSNSEQEAKLIISGIPLVFQSDSGEGMPYIDDQNRFMVPLRKCLEAIGATVGYDADSQVITASGNGISLTCRIGQRELTVNGTSVQMDITAQIREGRTYVPVRFIYEAFGKTVVWDDTQRSVNVQ